MQVFIAIKCLLQKEAMVHRKDTEFRNTGLERSEVLAKDLEWFRQQGHAIPEPLNPGVTYARYLEELSEKDPQAFICHFYNTYFAHSAGGRMIGRKISPLEVVAKNFEKNNVSGEMTDLELQLKNDEAVLANILQKSLKGKRYLIVLDDMWKSEAWDALRLYFPSENKGSGILSMTRNTEVARNAGTENLSLQMDLMGPDESWNLFKSIAFANEPLPSEFETIGKQIAEKYHGLPLTIAVIAGLLKSKRDIEDSEYVAKDVKAFFTNDPDKQCSHVLGLSYDHLTSDLKARLLHFGKTVRYQ
ncbi:Heme oxygenase 1, chloroplastic [Capsicum annuum]|uniref:heme oxygenase (biliverdin-producing) n=1 Tax=Capsicum annuum TaxID=4072 RepID=A0A2G2YUZ1_CAPAN|nr:Heme oxygenase 1, chloroplastic [Capsicum annuum]